jgi:hypothetical protein
MNLEASCSCRIDRRRLLQAAGSAGLLALAPPWAAEGDYEAMLLSCKRLIAIDHRDCGAGRIAYGAASIAEARIETEMHRKVLAEFRKEVARRQPRLTVETGLMALDGSIEMFAG